MPPATASRSTKRVEYLNTTQGYLGAIRINRRGEEESVAVEPGGRVFLNPEERELTDQSHALREHSPFTPQHVVHRDPLTGEVTFEGELCPLEDATVFQRSGGKLPTP